jgi:diguanylate cyclase
VVLTDGGGGWRVNSINGDVPAEAMKPKLDNLRSIVKRSLRGRREINNCGGLGQRAMLHCSIHIATHCRVTECTEETPTAAHPEAISGYRRVGPRRHSQMTKILVVDDNAANREVVRTLLEDEGYQASEAADGAAGLRVAEQEQPQLVISDILMPSMDGYEFVRQLRRNPKLAQTSVIFYTANYHRREAKKLAEQCGVDRVIIKPCGAREFLSAVTEVLSGVNRNIAPQIDEEFDRDHLRVLTNKLSTKADELSALNSRFAALTELNVQLASERDPSVLLQRVCAGARNLLGAKYAILAIAAEGDSDAPKVWSSGMELPGGPTPIYRIDEGFPGEAYLKRHAVRTSNSNTLSGDLRLTSIIPTAVSAVAVPVSSLTQTYGWLCLVDKLGSTEFDSHDERMLSTLGAQVGRIYENGSLYLEVQEHAAKLLVEMEERERATESLRDSEMRFRQVVENIDGVFFISSADLSKPIYVSPAFERIWGRSSDVLFQNPSSWVDMVHPADRVGAVRSRERASQNWPAQSDFEFRILRPDGQIRWILERLFPIMDATGGVSRAVGFNADITERKEAAAKVIQLSRVHAMMSGINSLIVGVNDREQLFAEACRLAVDEGLFRVAWCALLDTATGKVHVVESKGEIPEISNLVSPQMGTCATEDNIVTAALRSQKGQICNNLQSDFVNLHGHERLVDEGFRGIGVFPLVIAGSSVGCMVLMTDEIGLFDAVETRLLMELAGDISFALDHIGKAERLNYLAYYDPLTGLANRTLFVERLSMHTKAAARNASRFALIIVGPERLDGFNDALGRVAGEELFRQLAERLVEVVGSSDLVARIGPEQFAAIIPDLESDYIVQSTIERWWRDWLGPRFELEGHDLTISAKSGIALFPADGADGDSLLRNGQAALKKARESSSRQVFYTPNLSESLAERMSLDNKMRRALENEEFVLHYQPKVDMAQRRIVGVEALMRWQNPELGLIPPNKFIPIMEENGLIVEAGAWAMRRACLDRACWLKQGLKAPRVAVNVSALQLRHEDFVRTIAEILKDDRDGSGIDIEVTESVLMEDVADNIEKLSAIRDLGVQIALDDFGTGYSSLSYLARLPVETLKIDRSFVVAMLEDPNGTALVSAIISLASTLKLQTVAEGVETEEQAKILRLLRCDQMQGYLICKPLPFAEMSMFIGRSRA